LLEWHARRGPAAQALPHIAAIDEKRVGAAEAMSSADIV
jgi:hypothetical protein